MPATWLTSAEQTAWRNFITTLPDLTAALEADLAPYGLTLGDYEVLVFLSEAEEDRLRMCDLAGALRLSPSGLTRRLDGLVKVGWVERESSASDRRVMYAHLTRTGRSKMDEAAPHHVASVRRHLLNPIGDEGVQKLGDLFLLVREHLHALLAV
ncbi:MAG: MarR family transcriptional regulator [Actinobacteria bacterium]|uniref:Unannotated protein n=1 Tax=freshwater metagenome TaxID=449393 RepID=A0A6J6A3D1_9ZZZZ|nr:MarR family transcriptional regulator [Actinomycetota bacterium]MSW76229.1 MarR family transcriptional regulator [Actinomycetota bacterium]MSZ81939.1 MarR family transcriptional regulator [Actinomycetota bacterium]MTB16778.1 MarR family transcriptional regulator [Actinomycetota bacterium]